MPACDIERQFELLPGSKGITVYQCVTHEHQFGYVNGTTPRQCPMGKFEDKFAGAVARRKDRGGETMSEHFTLQQDGFMVRILETETDKRVSPQDTINFVNELYDEVLSLTAANERLRDELNMWRNDAMAVCYEAQQAGMLLPTHAKADDVMRYVLQQLEAAERDALERAASVCERRVIIHRGTGGYRHEIMEYEADKCANAIRQLAAQPQGERGEGK